MSDTDSERQVSLWKRIQENPRPAAIWASVLLVLVVLEGGALLSMVFTLVEGALKAYPSGNPFVKEAHGVVVWARDLPTLLSRDFIPNQGYDANGAEKVIEHTNADGELLGRRYIFKGPWKDTFLGLSPKAAWFLRFALVYAYSAVFLGWLYHGYRLFREHYRYADWTPRDDVVRRFRNHRWGIFGLVFVFMFLTMAVFSPALSPTTVDRNINNPYNFKVKYFDQDAGKMQKAYVGEANSAAESRGPGSNNVGPWQYDAYSRFHPFGTLPSGKDLFTFMMYGARVSLFVGLVAIGLSGLFATVFALLTAYYKGLVDLAVVIVGDSVMAIPQLLLLILVTAVFNGHWLEQIYNGGLLIALVFAFTGWPALWRAVRGPAFQVSTEEWIDAARSYGQRATVTMRKHMLPYVVGYLLVYASMTLGGIIITTAALSFLGIGIDAPTPEWGRAVSLGQPFLATKSWHIALIPGLMVVLIVTAFNALGDGIRDAIDPQSEGGDGGTEAAAAGGGG